jgi:biofilm PGA synthesis N-glycosyltransferase PgaC
VKYLVITPVKDEERYVEHTLRSMTSQTMKPVRWIIVEDGSSDRTPDLIEPFARDYEFIHVVHSPRGQPRQPGPAVIRAFNRGLEEAGRLGIDYDFIVKLDCDLSFDPDYFERLLAEFAANPKLGIASGVYWEAADDVNWREVEMPAYHAAGASKVIRRGCWEQIEGFIPSRGWDTVDEIRAMSHGWETMHFRDLKIKHWKLEGTGIGKLRTNAMHGEIYYLTGGGFLFFLLKVLDRAKRRPYFAGALSMFWGYCRTKLSGRPRLVTREEARCYRNLLNARLTGTLRRQWSGN